MGSDLCIFCRADVSLLYFKNLDASYIYLLFSKWDVRKLTFINQIVNGVNSISKPASRFGSDVQWIPSITDKKKGFSKNALRDKGKNKVHFLTKYKPLFDQQIYYFEELNLWIHDNFKAQIKFCKSNIHKCPLTFVT